MIKQHIKKGKDKAAEVAKKTVTQVGEEFAEIPKQTVKEAVGISSYRTSPIVEAMQQQTKEVEERAGKDDPKRRLDYLGKEIEELGKKREIEEEQKRLLKEQEALKKEEGPKVLLEPATKKKIGQPAFGKKKAKGTGELIKSKK